MSALTACRICQGTAFESIIDFGLMAQCGQFPKIGEEAPRLPLHLVRCASCGLAQLGDTYDPADLYGAHYGYRTGLNRSMVEHIAALVEQDIPKWADLRLGDAVLDIGSNDGTLLGCYPRDIRKVGIDPGMSIFKDYYARNIDKAEGFFGQVPLSGPFKVITSIAVFYDVDDPIAFARHVKELLTDDGVWILEQAYWPVLASHGVYDVVCHEHQAYYSMRDMERIMDKAGLTIRAVSQNATNGGSFRLIVGKHGTSGIAADLPLDVETFRKQVAVHGAQLCGLLRSYKARGKTVHGYGASTKGNTVLQWAGITPDLLPCILDVNESKRGCWTPGTHIPIVMKEDREPDAYLVLPWHFRESILKREAAFLQAGGELIFPFPQIEVVRW